ncbi:hypothetical protein [Methylomonas albis]|uniref:Uncharacterized protein n=1 Tax=Methylomonas albis TaxID=1854563 RepID=A0ABR9D1E1_9GAMM|nr:hypothetical protein [Methylomonas albis]MBD9356048.1 hypothetical protein [Methylomonas albis]CAD6879096.1 hypothetical protein [Methylomonas albis]
MKFSVGYQTPDDVYWTAVGGGVKIVDKFNGKAEACSRVEELGQRHSAGV